MIFTQKSIEKIVSGKKTQTRRLVKEGEEILFENEIVTDANSIIDIENKFRNVIAKVFGFPVVLTKKGRLKWQVGKTYAVQSGRGKPCVEYGKLVPLNAKNKDFIWTTTNNKLCGRDMKPLRIRITSIRKEKLLDITEEDAKKEGVENRFWFLQMFFKINKIPNRIIKKVNPKKENLVSIIDIAKEWNPFVWVISFEVV